MRRIETAVRGHATVVLQPVRENTGANNLMVVLLGKCFTWACTGRYNTAVLLGWGFCERTHRTMLLVFQPAVHLVWCLFTKLFLI